MSRRETQTQNFQRTGLFKSSSFLIPVILVILLFIDIYRVTSYENEQTKYGHRHKADSLEDFALHKLMYNEDARPSWLTGYLNSTVIEEKCEKAKPCYASDEVVPLCASDNLTYLNPGVFMCAQECDPSDSGFGPCPHHKFPSMLSKSISSTDKPKPTTPPHKSSKYRVKVRGNLRKFLEWGGFHIHDDGGLYFHDEMS